MVIDISPDFFHTSTYQKHKEINPSRVKDTCRWFLDHPAFQKWKSSSHDDLLWLSADPGCGKSVLSKALVDDKLVDDGYATVCYFFFKDNEEQNNMATAICALLHQLLLAQQSLFQKHAERQVHQHGTKLKADSNALWQLWIAVAFDSTNDVICILDALDECQQSDRNRLMQELERFYTTSQERRQVGQKCSKLKFLVTSRPYRDIEWGFGELTNRYPTIRLAADDEWKRISDEINIAMEAKVDEIVDRRRLGEEIRTALKQRFFEIPNRTYLWLYLTLDVLRNSLGLTKRKLLRRIDEMPKSVEQAYEEILRRSDNENEGDGRRLLEIIVAAPRPLTLSEIDIALEIQPSSRSYGDLDLEGTVKRKEWIRDACGLFVSVIDSRAHLIHQTAREFLLRRVGEHAALGTWKHSICLQDAHLALTKICITYLNFDDFQNGYFQRRLNSKPGESFTNYAANHWIYHTQRVNLMHEEWATKAAKLCEVGDGRFPFWIDYHNSATHLRHEVREKPRTLYWAIKWSLLQVIPLLLDQGGVDVEITDEMVKVAASNQFSGGAVMKLLLDQRGTGVPITEEVVIAAVSNLSSGIAVMKLLFDQRGANVQISEKVIIAATSNISSGGAMMKLLLNQRGADIPITVEVVKAAVSNLASGDAVMKLLLDQRGTDVPITKEIIKATAAAGNSVVMKLLLDQQRADLQITEGIVKAAILNPFSGDAVMKVLLDQQGVDVPITEAVVKVAISNPFSGGAVMKLLFDQQGAHIPMTKEVVKAAAAAGNVAVMKLLLDRGVDVLITKEVVKAAISNPLSGGAMMKLLFNQRGADIPITEEAVKAAVSNPLSGDAVMKVLLDQRGADVPITEEVVKAAIMNPFSGGAVMKLLFDQRGADVPITKEVVKAAAKNSAVMKLLFDQRGADVPITEEVVKAAT
ncbi:ankyrin [Penicillium cosmopolitanum]|uniref:Ankyrin n=1 Tax=Penicillium cosmopolitanum TaxID=1131564 RepID=A0A9W9VBX3_9EURO|nr:ankyrin [Penicillium cosmopolitanum]KAJ5376448.1 ankyrin [Penicillium cosmopolitanum]